VSTDLLLKISGLHLGLFRRSDGFAATETDGVILRQKSETMNDGIENLKPYQTEDEAREGGRKGGIASGAARRRKRDMREWAEILGQTLMMMKTPDGKEVAEGDMAAAVVLKQYQKAINKGDTAAAAFLMRLRGEDVQKVEQVDDEVKRNAIREQLKQLYGIED
jgi:hypothetical protein